MYMVSSGLVGLGLKTAVEAAPLKMAATDVGKTSGTHNLRPRPTSPEDTLYIDAGRESLNQYITNICSVFISIYKYINFIGESLHCYSGHIIPVGECSI